MLKKIAILYLLIFSSTTIAADSETSYEGVWQDVENRSNYYAIHENGDRLILIVLPGIEQTGNTLRFSYIGVGDETDLTFTRLSSESFNDFYQQLKIEFVSPDEGYLFPACDVCSIAEDVIINIIKVF